MKKFNLWDIDTDAHICEFKGTEKEARKKAIQIAKKHHIIVNVDDAVTGEDIATVNEQGDVYI